MRKKRLKLNLMLHVFKCKYTNNQHMQARFVHLYSAQWCNITYNWLNNQKSRSVYRKIRSTIGVLCASERPRLALICSILVRFSFLRRFFPPPLITDTASPTLSDVEPPLLAFTHTEYFSLLVYFIKLVRVYLCSLPRSLLTYNQLTIDLHIFRINYYALL